MRPRIVLGLGLAGGAPALRVETFAINAVHLGVADNDGAAPLGAEALRPGEPDSLRATWDAPAVVERLRAAGLPARLSFHAGTHLCNATLYAMLAALLRADGAGRRTLCGFLHLPYLPDQVVWLMRKAAGGAGAAAGGAAEAPSMALPLQIEAVRLTLACMVEALDAGA